MKRCLLSLASKEIQIKPQGDTISHLSRWPLSKTKSQQALARTQRNSHPCAVTGMQNGAVAMETAWTAFSKYEDHHMNQHSQVALGIKNPPASSEDIRGAGSVPGSGRSPGAGHDNPPRYSCLEHPMDSRAWGATGRGVAPSWTRLSE